MKLWSVTNEKHNRNLMLDMEGCLDPFVYGTYDTVWYYRMRYANTLGIMTYCHMIKYTVVIQNIQWYRTVQNDVMRNNILRYDTK